VKGKEYCGGKLIFEGEYLNRERNGKGKEYDYNGKLLFTGEYLNGKRWNGKIYNDNTIYELKNGKGYIREHYWKDKLFEGEYLNGKKLKGKEYDSNGNLIFKGSYLNQKGK